MVVKLFCFLNDHFYEKMNMNRRKDRTIILNVELQGRILTGWFFMATGERISNKSIHTGTDRGMIRDMTFGILTTNTGTNILAFVV